MEDYHKRQRLVLEDSTGNKIKTTKILVIGVGAGGNEVLKNLALMGFGNFTVVDFDPIEAHNLSRTTLFSKKDVGKSKAEVAAVNLQEIALHEAPIIIPINNKIQDVGKQIFLDNDIVVCCVDTNNARAYINDWCVKLKKPLFELGFERFVVQVNFFPNENSTDPCLREVIGFGEFTGRRNSCSQLVVGDDKLNHIPTIQVSAALAGAFVASEIIMFLQESSKLKNKMLQYSSEYQTFNIFSFTQSTKCNIHKDNDLVIIDSKLTKENTVHDLITFVKSKTNEDCILSLHDDFILTMKCESCDDKITINKYKSQVYDKERWCDNCQDKYEERAISKPWEFVRELILTNPKHKNYLHMNLSSLMIRDNDLLRVDSIHNFTTSYLIKIN